MNRYATERPGVQKENARFVGLLDPCGERAESTSAIFTKRRDDDVARLAVVICSERSNDVKRRM
jgi:hypothetical protein